jgi:hypothetical protein
MTGRARTLWLALLALGCRHGDRVTVVNHSGVAIISLRVTVDQTSFDASDVADGAQRSWDVQPSHDASFAVHGKLADGSSVSEANVGYLTPGKPVKHVLLIERWGKITYRIE